MPDFDILDLQAMASIVVDKFGVTTSNEDEIPVTRNPSDRRNVALFC